MRSGPLIKFALVGCGNIGRRHAKLITEFGILTAVCDINLDNAKNLVQDQNIPIFIAYEAMLSKIRNSTDVIVICTPNYLHASQTIIALNSGFHVLCEKPMAINYEDCLEMIATAQKTRKLLHVVKQNRFNPPVQYLKNLLEAKALGNIFSFQLQGIWNRPEKYYTSSDWRGKKEMDGGILYTQYSHFIDLIIWMLGPMKCEYATGSNYLHQNVTAFEDTIFGNLRSKEDALGSFFFTTCAFSENMEGSLTIFGENGTIKIGGPYLNDLCHHRVNGMNAPSLGKSMPENDYSYYKGTMNNHHKVYEGFIFAIHHGEFLNKNMEEAALVVAQIEDIHNSLNCKRQ